ncbi:hypothetical protein CapIbe_016139 [Capra ibex]
MGDQCQSGVGTPLTCELDRVVIHRAQDLKMTQTPHQLKRSWWIIVHCHFDASGDAELTTSHSRQDNSIAKNNP